MQTALFSPNQNLEVIIARGRLGVVRNCTQNALTRVFTNLLPCVGPPLPIWLVHTLIIGSPRPSCSGYLPHARFPSDRRRRIISFWRL